MAGNWLIRNGQSKVISFVLIMGLLLGSIIPAALSTTPVYADVDISAEVDAAITEVKGYKSPSGVGINPDWILTMVAAGMGGEISQADKDTFLSTVLMDVRDANDKNAGSVGSLSKYALALTALDIDPRHIPDDNRNSIDLIGWIAEKAWSNVEGISFYDLPYVLLLFNSGKYSTDGYGISTAKLAKNLVGQIMQSYEEEKSLWVGPWGASYDDVGMILPALTKYYKSSEETLDGIVVADIKTAVDGAINVLSNNQTANGGFDGGWGENSNTASTVASGLISLEINPHIHGDFIKNSHSLMTNIISFSTTGGLSYTIGGSADSYASFQGFQALAVFKNLTSGTGITNIYDISDKSVTKLDNWPVVKRVTGIEITTKPSKILYDQGSQDQEIDTAGMVVTAHYNNRTTASAIVTDYTVSKIDAGTAGTKKVTVTYSGHTATFNVTVKNTDNSVPKVKTVKITVKDADKNEIARDNAYPIEPNNTTVLEVLKAVLTEKGTPYTIIGSYVSSIAGLDEFGEGSYSGWLYYIGGKDPVIGAADYALKGGENILWFYTLDYTQESSAEKWTGNLTKEETGPVSKDDLNEALADIKAGKKDSWTADTANGSVSFDKDALEGLIEEMGKDTIEVTIEPTPAKDLTTQQKEAAGDRPVFDIKVLMGGKEVGSFKGKLTITLPYKLKEGELATGVVVYHINDKGELTLMEGHYDSATGNVIFTVDHLSLYVIAYDATKAVWPFTDVKQSSDNWYYPAVKYTYEKGIFTGTSVDKFSPDVALSRAMLASVLARMSGADLTVYQASAGGNSISKNFTDVDVNSWYGPSVAWAKEVGIISGYENKDGTFAFRPDNKISRQDIAVMIHNFNEKVQKKAYTKVDAVKFIDQAEIPEYAMTAVQAMQEADIISGFQEKDGSYSFRPTGITSRAQAANLVYNMLTK